VVSPVEDPSLRKELRAVLDLQLKPNHAGWEMRSDGTYVRAVADDLQHNCQQALIDLFTKREREESKSRRRRRRGFARRAVK